MTTPSASTALIRVHFWGAAHTVTGSMHRVETPGKTFLLDCGLFQGKRSEARQRNSTFPFATKDIDAVVISHAHIDHIGKLPMLFRQGFAGPVHCTPATRDLMAIMLADSAHIQEEDAKHLNKRRPAGQPKVEPLYDQQDVVRTMKACQSVPYDRTIEISKGVELTFVDAGHLLGSAMVHLEVEHQGRKASLTFTGDLGRKAQPILRDPAPVPACDLLISESTYGGRNHEPMADTAALLGEVVRRTIDRGGKLLIPAFSLGRTQTIVLFLHELIRAGKLPDVQVFVDSPLASEATAVFRMHPECFDEATLELLDRDPDLFGGQRIQYVRSTEDSKKLNARPGPAVIISASGMCEAGRILHHLKHNIADPRTTVLLAGYQAPETLGRRLAEHRPEVKIFDQMIPLRAEVVMGSGFSSHAGHDDLVAYLSPLVGKAKKVCLVHGEPESSEALAVSLREKGFTDVTVPDRGDVVEVG